MNTLIAVGTGAAYVYSLVATFLPGVFTRAGLPGDVYYEAVSSIIAFILLGRLLEARAKGRTSEAVRRLAGLKAKRAHVLRDGKETETVVEAVVPGDLVVVKPGEKAPSTPSGSSEGSRSSPCRSWCGRAGSSTVEPGAASATAPRT